MLKLKEILLNIFEDLEDNKYHDGYDACSSLKEQIDLETYSLLSELRLNLENYYNYINSKIRGMFLFEDDNKIEHFIRLVFENNRWEVKIGFFKVNSSIPIYDRPHIYNNLDYDEKIFNTHLKILIEEIIPYFFSNKSISNENKKLFLPALDIPRYRLYRIALSKFINKSIYKIKLYPNNKLIVIEK